MINGRFRSTGLDYFSVSSLQTARFPELKEHHPPVVGKGEEAPSNKPITGMVRYGEGYLMVASDGGVFNFSDQPFLGHSVLPPARPIVAVAPLQR